MSTARIGFYGKLPCHGGFVWRNVAEGFVKDWDRWLQRCLVESAEQLGVEWSRHYLESPAWRFVLEGGAAGSACYAGLLVPSIDTLGRHFPLTVVAELPMNLAPLAAAILGRPWFNAVESVALAALGAQQFGLERFSTALDETAQHLASMERAPVPVPDGTSPSASHHWRVPIESTDKVASVLIDTLMAPVERASEPLSIWWTEGSQHVGASCLLVRDLPDPRCFTAMLDGSWRASGWNGETTNHLAADPPQPPPFRTVSAAVTDIGPVRKANEDAFLLREDLSLWAVADGMGGHSRGAEASQMVVDALASVSPSASLRTVLAEGRNALERVNADLQRATMRGDDRSLSGSTVALLSVRHREWRVLWAGDSRVYLLRGGTLSALTRDHSEEEHSQQAVNGKMGAATVRSGLITRAVGAYPQLVLDQESGVLLSGDRFLLCSDGLHGVVPDAEIQAVLNEETSPAVAVSRLIDMAKLFCSRDNITAVVVDILPGPDSARAS